MDIKGLSLTDQLRMVRGVENILPKPKAQGDADGGQKVSFGEYLVKQLDEVNKDGIAAEKAIQKSITGEEKNPHETLIAVEKADISLSLLMSVKDRIVRAYQEIIRTPL